ncbi:MAG TPA: DUF177 domain-containing protein [Blastocatellia bacterium]|nr:DUF177 domain-containing protein [Blastocatellia bacterium]
MLISLARLTENGLRFEHQYKDSELDLSGHEFLFTRPPLASGRVDRVGVDIRLRGQIRAELELPCDRCLEPVGFEIETPVDLFFSPGEYEAGKTGETELTERDLDFSVYENDEINLDEVILEQLELNLPMHVLCGEDCKGLCPQCGTNLNVEKCQCEAPIDPRWQALADLRNRGDE